MGQIPSVRGGGPICGTGETTMSNTSDGPDGDWDHAELDRWYHEDYGGEDQWNQEPLGRFNPNTGYSEEIDPVAMLEYEIEDQEVDVGPHDKDAAGEPLDPEALKLSKLFGDIFTFGTWEKVSLETKAEFRRYVEGGR